MSLQLKEKVAIVTGAGNGLGRTHALELARHGACVVVNDINAAAHAVAAEIKQSGGTALSVVGDVSRPEDVQAMVNQVIDQFGRIDILVNNAGVLRDKTFEKMSSEDFRLVFEVHVMGAVHMTKAVWPQMKKQGYGRVVLTTSSSGLYGNFGQANYSAAKMALVGLMKTLGQEGAKYDIRVNCLAPTALTAMTAGLLPPEAVDVFTPERVSVALLALVREQAPTQMIMLAGGGGFECAHITMTRGIYLKDEDDPAEALCQRIEHVQDTSGQILPETGWAQSQFELAKALT
ncbi:SDR family NAD(P)-dependent oxidoreductase [Allopusillimonas ginsengisoli]|uniref:SDR family NAD(P)-dependent oxidoreductase n=1 Tax=Allopusillimonas ginsengisoli TaxID=453575 RepID=UPI0039C0575B